MRKTDSEATANERRFSNEIFALIIEYFTDDIPTLKNIALVCRDFASLSQPFIFRAIDLSLNSFKVERFMNLLRQPQTTFLGKYVRRLDYGPEDAEAFISIITKLPSLVAFKIAGLRTEICRGVKDHLGEKLEELQLYWVSIHELEDFHLLQSMLASLGVLKFLSLNAIDFKHHSSQQVLILPSSLKVLSLRDLDQLTLDVIAQGMHISSNSRTLQTIFIDDGTCKQAGGGCDVFWKALGRHTRIVLDLGYPAISFAPAIAAGIKGVKSKELVISCIQHRTLAAFLAKLLPALPNFLHDFCIDFSPTQSAYASDSQNMTGWAELDTALQNRNELGLLKRVRFKCTRRDGSHYYRGSLSIPRGSSDRRVLSRIEHLLPRSRQNGFVEVDDVTIFFRPIL
ncbi:hypothetical protein GYMLUDRAFT_51093 [Collybiopsis luxurians FD-317 M1]|uniref:F-box domain-containing protein n=1 Tax=Collybiopsis luxurians FD-317 M1 TaxID=944289 RepID=A0A0D0BMC2_9AGAR|nr:hypothetical protein GYMLUDRAFT_51093 [Collybiopsis luxurians FD-317 M1]